MPARHAVIGTLVTAAAIVAAACGAPPAVDGAYKGQDGSILDALTFMPGGRVDVTFVGIAHKGTYLVEGDTVTVIAPDGTRTPLRIASNGCLLGSAIVGTYCKSPGSGAATPRGGGAVGLTSTYEATMAEGRIRLEFQPGRKVLMTMTEAVGRTESIDATYRVSGDRITIGGRDGAEMMTLTQAGDGLDAVMDGQAIRFNAVRWLP